VPDEQLPTPRDGQDLQAALLAAVGDGTVLIGNTATLASGFGVSVAALRVALRELLEARRIAVYADDRDHLTVRLERRTFPGPPPAIERRRSKPDPWPL